MLGNEVLNNWSKFSQYFDVSKLVFGVTIISFGRNFLNRERLRSNICNKRKQ